MYDDNQRSIETKFSTTYGLPILYLPQLLGLALGIPSRDLGFPMNKVKTQPVLAKLGAQ
jgi:heterodisulfide reductase subunit B